MRREPKSPAFPSRPLAAPLRPLAAALLASLCVWGAAADASRESQEAPAPPDTAVEVTPEGQWLTDDAGLEYRVERVPKVEGAYSWIDESKNEVMLPLGSKFEVLRYDDRWFWVKYIKPQIELPPAMKKDAGPTVEEVAEVAESYEFDLPEVDRLRFEDFGRGLPRLGQWRNGFDLADMNGDGHLDIVFGPARKGVMRPNVFLGDGRGNWRPWREARFPNLPYDYGDVAVADFNADGHPDMAFGIHLRGMLVIVSDGEGGFQPWSEGIGLTEPGKGGDISAFSSRAVETVDWNGDGKIDVIGLGEGPKGTGTPATGIKGMVDTSRGFLVYLNKGDGSWHPWRPVRGTNLRLNFGDDFVLGDLNRDGFYDLVSDSRQIGSRQVLRVGVEGGRIDVASIAEVRDRSMVTAVAAADLDADGHEDLVLGYLSRELDTWRSGIDVLYGASDFTWKRRTLYSEQSRRGISALAAGELDADGEKDLVALTGRGEAWFFLADGEGWYVRENERLMPAEMGCTGYGLRLVDFDGDGRDEVVASFAGEQTGMPGLPGLSHPGCTAEGSLRAWRPVPAPATQPAPATAP